MNIKDSNKIKLFNKFPKTLRNALNERIVSFNDSIEITFDDFAAYRCIKRGKNETDIIITKEDFKSHIERGIKGINSKEISSYGCSLFIDVEDLRKAFKNVWKYPIKHHIIKGYVKDKNGIIEKSKNSSHVDWWIYEGRDEYIVNDFEVINNE